MSTPLETKASAARSHATPPPLSLRLSAPRVRRVHLPRLPVLWFGAFTSTVGTWMQKVAQSWLVFDLTKSSFYLGLDDFLGQLPILLFTLIGGVIADRHDRRQLLLGSQYVQMATAFTLAVLVLTQHVHDLAHPGAVVHHRLRAGVRRSGVPVAGAVARAQERSAERDRAELDPVQPRARVRPAARRARRWPPSARPPASG